MLGGPPPAGLAERRGGLIGDPRASDSKPAMRPES